MNDKESGRVDRLVGDIFDSEMTSDERRETIAELESLLLDRSDLQQHYASLIELNLAIEHEWDLDATRQRPIVPLANRTENEGWANADSGARADSVARAAPSQGTDDFRARRRLLVLAASLALIVSTSIYFAWFADGTSSGVQPYASVSANRVLELTVQDFSTLSKVSDASGTTTLASLKLMGRRDASADKVTLCGGTAWMVRTHEPIERGYVVALPGDSTLDVSIASDAGMLNRLAIVELDERGWVLERRTSFDSFEPGEITPSDFRTSGTFAAYTIENDSSQPRFFLFAASHRIDAASTNEVWHQSDFEIRFDNDSMLVIGWDDKGFGERVEANADGLVPDNDYDDLVVSLRFTIPGLSTTLSSGTHVTSNPPQKLPLETTTAIGRGTTVRVKPREELLLNLSSSTRLATKVEVVDASNGTVVWGQMRDAEVIGDRRQRTIDGALLIRNPGDTVIEYEIHAWHADGSSTDSAKWSESPVKIVDGQSRTRQLEFSHKSTQFPYAWPAVHVHAQWFDQNR
jgi:hypothetical protein